MIEGNRKGGIMGTVIAVATLALVVFVVYFVLKGFISLILGGAWIFLGIAAILDYKVIVNYGKRLLSLFKTNALYGIGASILSVVLYPFLFFILMMRAIGSKFVKKIGFDLQGQPTFQKEKEEFADYEEIIEDELDLRQIETRNRER